MSGFIWKPNPHACFLNRKALASQKHVSPAYGTKASHGGGAQAIFARLSGHDAGLKEVFQQNLLRSPSGFPHLQRSGTDLKAKSPS